jgi:hypothetical protein
MTQLDKQWNMKYEQLVEFKRKNGHCVVPAKYEQDKSLGIWVRTQRIANNNNTIGFDRKEELDRIGFAWKAYAAHQYKPDDKLWHQQYEKLLEYKRKSGHCKVPNKHKDDKSLGTWVRNQRARHARNEMRQGRKKLLNKIGFAWKHCTLAARSSTTNVRGVAI